MTFHTQFVSEHCPSSYPDALSEHCPSSYPAALSERSNLFLVHGFPGNLSVGPDSDHHQTRSSPKVKRLRSSFAHFFDPTTSRGESRCGGFPLPGALFFRIVIIIVVFVDVFVMIIVVIVIVFIFFVVVIVISPTRCVESGTTTPRLLFLAILPLQKNFPSKTSSI